MIGACGINVLICAKKKQKKRPPEEKLGTHGKL